MIGGANPEDRGYRTLPVHGEGTSRVKNYQTLAALQNEVISSVCRKIDERLDSESSNNSDGHQDTDDDNVEAQIPLDDDPAIRANSNELFLINLNLELQGIKSVYERVQKRLAGGSNEFFLKLLWERLGSPLVEGTVTGFSIISAIQSISAGTSAVTFQQSMEIAARYIAPITGAITAIDGIMGKNEDKRIELAQRIWKATNQTIKNSAFTLSLVFYLITEVIRAEKHESSDSEVDISNSAAAMVILGCLSVSLMSGIRVYFIEEEDRREDLGEYSQPSLLKRALRFITCNPISSRLLGFLTGAAAIHWLVTNIQNLVGTTTSTLSRIIRYYLTAFGGLPTILLGYPLPGRPFIYHTQIYFGLLITQATALVLDAYQKFNSPNSESFWGSATIREQIYYWAIAFPTAIFSIQAALFGWHWWVNSANSTSERSTNNTGPDHNESPLFHLETSPRVMFVASAPDITLTRTPAEGDKKKNPSTLKSQPM